MTTRRRLIAGGVVLSAALLGGCTFNTDALDERSCTSSDDCSAAYPLCIDGICQGILESQDTGVADAPDDEEQPVEPCVDFDRDGVFAGPECEAELIDCNDFDPDIFPGADEICDGKDNDCNGPTDLDDDGFLPEPCPLSQGVCAGTEHGCEGGTVVECDQSIYGPDFEGRFEASCDGLDNDCDGRVDEGISRACYSLGLEHETLAVAGAPCIEGVERCVEGGTGEFSGTCQGEVVPVDEDESTPGNFLLRCDSIDNDCDGSMDEACACNPGQLRSCYSLGLDDPSADNVPCSLGYQVCGDNARFGSECIDELTPGVEDCTNPGVDDDCNGIVDDVPGLGDACDVGSPGSGECDEGVLGCLGATANPVCVPTFIRGEETCDNEGVDNDCNGRLDDVPGRGEDCSSSGRGICKIGSLDCRSGDLDCIPGSSSSESCNGEDDDCDGTIDDGFDFDSDQHCGGCGNNCGSSTCCDGTCRNLQTDDLNCGGCGDSIFEEGLDFPDCCGGTATDLDMDGNCGSCGVDCGGSEECCLDDAADGYACIDTQASDEMNCGGCGVTCGVDEACCGGMCIPLSDPANCGGCDGAEGEACEGGEGCCGEVGTFACVDLTSEDSCQECASDGSASALDCTDEGFEDCCGGTASAPGACILLDTLGNCGACGEDCLGSDCGGDPCGTPACCGGGCADLEVIGNCGECGEDCSGMGFTTAGCCAQTCVDINGDDDACGPSCTNCTGGTPSCCGGSCTSLLTDEDNCGACGNECDTGEGFNCCGGFCVHESSLDHCGGCADELGDDCDLFQGERCCFDTDEEPDAFICADPDDYSLDDDEDNCGECGKRCDEGETCVAGECES